MTKYKVVGDKLFDFYTIVEADYEEDAIEAARALESHKWMVLENDRVIDPYQVEIYKDSFVLTEMDISDKSEQSVGGGPTE